MSPEIARTALGLVLIGLAACSEAECIAGREGCPCAAENTCESSPDAPLTCDRGWCVARECVRGAEGCACYGNGTCDPRDGVPMTCEGDVCRRTIEPEPGALNGRCLEGNTCGDHEGTPLACTNDRCELADCPSGALGCPCASFGACDLYGGSRQPVCASGTCALEGCSEGADGCACRGDGSCDAGLCQRGLCLAEPGAPLIVTGDVRSCEIVVEAEGTESLTATFAADVLGHARRRGDRLAIAFVQRRDVAFTEPPARVIARTAPRLISSTCFDRLGHRAGGAFVRLGDAP